MQAGGEKCVWQRDKVDALFRDASAPPSERLERDVHDPAVDRLEADLLRAVGLPVQYAGLSNVLDYQPGAEYNDHTDCSNQRMNDRVFSLLVYLSDVTDGSGSTAFPELGIEVAPRRRRVLLWRNLGPGGPTAGRQVGACDPRTLHRASTLLEGSRKQVFQMWFHQRPPNERITTSRVVCEGSGSCRLYWQESEEARLPLGEHTYSAGARRTLRQDPSPDYYSTSDPYFDHMVRGIKADGRGDVKEAAAAFAALATFSNDALHLGNAGQAMGKLARTLQDMREIKGATQFFRFSVSYYEKALERTESGLYDMTNLDPAGARRDFKTKLKGAQEALATFERSFRNEL